MGDESTSNSVSQLGGIDGNKSYETQVVLNVYDLTPLNNYTVWFGLGIFHSGIEGENSFLFILSFLVLCVQAIWVRLHCVICCAFFFLFSYFVDSFLSFSGHSIYFGLDCIYLF